MFALRNIAGARRPDTEKPAVDALAAGFADDSELFKCAPLPSPPLPPPFPLSSALGAAR